MRHNTGQRHSGPCHRNPILLVAAARKAGPAVFLAIVVGPIMACGPQSKAMPVPLSSASADAARSAPSSMSCKGGTIVIGPVSRRFVITEISETKTVRGKNDNSFALKLRPIRQITSDVNSWELVDKSAVYSAFLKKVPVAVPLGQASPLAGMSGTITAGGPGVLATFESVERVEAAFTHRCGGSSVSGVVTSWQKPGSALIQCDSKQKPNTDTWKEAVALTC